MNSTLLSQLTGKMPALPPHLPLSEALVFVHYLYDNFPTITTAGVFVSSNKIIAYDVGYPNVDVNRIGASNNLIIKSLNPAHHINKIEVSGFKSQSSILSNFLIPEVMSFGRLEWNYHPPRFYRYLRMAITSFLLKRIGFYSTDFEKIYHALPS